MKRLLDGIAPLWHSIGTFVLLAAIVAVVALCLGLVLGLLFLPLAVIIGVFLL